MVCPPMTSPDEEEEEADCDRLAGGDGVVMVVWGRG